MRGLIFLVACCLVKGAFAQPHVNIVPQPASIQGGNDVIQFDRSVQVYLDPSSGIDESYAGELLTEMGFEVVWVGDRRQAGIRLLRKGRRDDESYRLLIGSGKMNNTVIAQAGGKRGLLHALQTLRQMVAAGSDGHLLLPICQIEDRPAFPWRAYMLDESRHFHGKAVVKGLLDEMARLKLNTFHWHLVDDPAWRLEIKKYPLLTEVASKGDYGHMMKYTNSEHRWDSLFVEPDAQFYTQEDIREIVSYAAVRGISIVPEIEVPGHATASIYAYPWLGASSKHMEKGVHGDLYDVTDPKVEQFLHDVLDEVVELFPAGVIHIGGDEANYTHWKNSKEINAFMQANNIPTYADLQVWAINRMSDYIAGKGYRMIGWNEITGDNIRGEAHVEAGRSENLAEGTIVQFWDGDVSLINKAIDRGYDVVNSNRHFTYLDYSYETTPFEKAYAFNPVPDGVAERDKKKVLGLGCQMWGEFIPTSERLYYQTFPRIAAFAEVGWVAQDRKTTYQAFRKRLTEIEKLWEKKGYIQHQRGLY
ncbi:hexosaminidase [Parapedobacter composti]|uniref:beta-N-acetylhexosaminidase n=1 Tax=Parapedobacter composti TaxID=623281 RepID=A0A1I1L0F2_9SPHI|nr:beta-N-acetylhexosaminidase [Parapedobacter composti]SFC66546.1 hexosaminidase [Parapedobacter composti]